MRKTHHFICLILIIAKPLFAQVDTTDWFPLQKGNLWEYSASSLYEGQITFQNQVLGDTLMPNGKTYRVMQTSQMNGSKYSKYNLYYRVDSNTVLRYSANSLSGEFKFMDFNVSDSTIWLTGTSGPEGNARGYVGGKYDTTYFHFFHRPIESKIFEDVYADSSKCIWTPTEASVPIRIAKGIGVVRWFIFSVADWWLSGAIINGAKLGKFAETVKPERGTTQQIK
jgi:hypothetical protein